MGAHSIKNPDIIHWLSAQIGYGIYNPPYENWSFKLSPKYTCTFALTPSKVTDDKSKVTCQNCLRLIKKYGHIGKVLLTVEPNIIIDKIGRKVI